MFGKFKNLLLVAVLTGLIWAWAEQSMTAPLNKQTVLLEITVPENSDLVILDPGSHYWTRSITVRLTADFMGQQSSVNRLREAIRVREYPAAHVIPPQSVAKRILPETRMGQLTLNLVDVLNSQTAADIAVEAVYPAQYDLRIGRLESCELPVAVEFPDRIRRNVTVKPAWVQVKLPPGVYSRDKQLVAVVPREAASKNPNQPIKVTLPAQLEQYRIDPKPADVEVTVNYRLTQHKVENVPVQLTAGPELSLQDYDLGLDRSQWRKTIVAEGPEDVTLSGDDVRAYLDLSPEDPKSGKVVRDVRIVLPPGFELVSPQPGTADSRVEINFTKRGETRLGP